MTNQKWPELYIYSYGIEDEGIKNSFMWIVYPNGSIDFLDEDGTSRDSCYIDKSSLLFYEYVELVGEIKPYPAEKRWKPKYRGRYFYISDCIEISDETWLDWWTDKERFEEGNCFRTKKEAEKKLERIKEVLNDE